MKNTPSRPQRFYAALAAWFPPHVRARIYLVGIALLAVGVVQGIITEELVDSLERLLAALVLGMALGNTPGPADTAEPNQ